MAIPTKDEYYAFAAISKPLLRQQPAAFNVIPT
jgi:hypothetical protein